MPAPQDVFLHLTKRISLEVSRYLPVRMRISFYLSGFPPIPGQKATGAEQGFVAALVAADKLASTETVEIADEEDDDGEEVGCHPYIMTLLISFYA